jgi:flagellar export protein FliJ
LRVGPLRRFEFSLQTALDLRRREEQAAQQRLAESQRVAEAVRAHLRSTEARYAEVVGAIRRGIAGRDDEGRRVVVELGEVAHAEDYLFRLRELIELQQRRLEQATEVCARRRQEVLAAAQRRKTLERLRERRETEHRREALVQEHRWLDEVAVTTYSGRKSGPMHSGSVAADRAA